MKSVLSLFINYRVALGAYEPNGNVRLWRIDGIEFVESVYFFRNLRRKGYECIVNRIFVVSFEPV